MSKQMKRTVTLALALLLLLSLLPCGVLAAGTVASGACGSLTWTLDSEGTLTVSGTGEMPDFAYGEQPWKDHAGSIRKVVLKSGVTSVGQYAFFSFESLQAVTIPAGVTSIGYQAFSGCSALAAVSIPGSVKTIDSYAFYLCAGMKSLTISEGVERIGYGAFSCCEGVTAVTIPASVTEIGGEAFGGCSVAAYRVNAGNEHYCTVDGVLFTADRRLLVAYPAGKSGEAYAVPATVTTVESGAFQGADKLRSVLLPESVDTIGFSAFVDCTALESIVIPKTVTYIGSGAFRGCTALKSIMIPAGVTEIGNVTFSHCSSLQSVTIPDSVTSIGYEAFSRCYGLTDVYFTGSSAAWSAVAIDGENGCLTAATIHYNASAAPGSIASVTAKAAAGKITVSWTAAPNAAAYVVQRRVKDTATWTTLAGNAGGLSFEDASAEAGTYYQYRVRGRSGADYGPFRVSSVVRAPAAAVPGAIASVTAAAAPGKINVSWSASAGATAYILQRRVKDSDTWTTLRSNITGLSYEDATGEAGVIYQYRVRGRNGTVYGPFKVSSVVRAKAA